ncbi:hypothetical protein Tco_0998246, partial [Tanacetum coccineum]
KAISISRSIDHGSRFTKRTSFYGSFGIPFSLSGRVLSIRRTRLTPASLEMCTQERIHTSNLEDDCLEIEEQILEAETGYQINLSDEEIVLDEQARSGSGDSE